MGDSSQTTLDEAMSFYGRVTDPTARAILDYLIDHPDERFNGAELVAHIGLNEHREVAHSTYLMGEKAIEMSLERPWRESQLGYLLPSEIAAVLRQARSQTGDAMPS